MILAALLIVVFALGTCAGAALWNAALIRMSDPLWRQFVDEVDRMRAARNPLSRYLSPYDRPDPR